MTRAITVAFAIGLLGCSTGAEQPAPTDKVRDSETAIQIGKKSCDDRGGSTYGHWTANFHAGLWSIEHLYPNGDPKCNWERVKVWADNGKADACEICVIAT
jgi:hypothetical protein